MTIPRTFLIDIHIFFDLHIFFDIHIFSDILIFFHWKTYQGVWSSASSVNQSSSALCLLVWSTRWSSNTYWWYKRFYLLEVLLRTRASLLWTTTTTTAATTTIRRWRDDRRLGLLNVRLRETAEIMAAMTTAIFTTFFNLDLNKEGHIKNSAVFPHSGKNPLSSFWRRPFGRYG